MASTLHIIATPIGNLGDITLRAKEVLAKVEVLFAEDTREVRKLLDLLGISAEGKKILSLASHNMKTAIENAVEILREGRDVGFVSDRGTPGVSDPGSLLVRSAVEAGMTVLPVPGASAVTALVSCSYLVDREFAFVGFLPETASRRAEVLDNLGEWNIPVVLFESPKRIRQTIAELAKRFPQAEFHAGRELTKVFESHLRFTSSEVPELPEQGEYVVLFRPNRASAADESSLEQLLEERLMSDRDWSKQMAQRHDFSARDLYNGLMERRRLPKS